MLKETERVSFSTVCVVLKYDLCYSPSADEEEGRWRF